MLQNVLGGYSRHQELGTSSGPGYWKQDDEMDVGATLCDLNDCLSDWLYEQEMRSQHLVTPKSRVVGWGPLSLGCGS